MCRHLSPTKRWLGLFLGVACFPTIVHASAPEFAWVKSAGGAGTEQGTALAADSAGNSFDFGRFSSPTMAFGQIVLTNGNLFLAKYDSAGTPQWALPVTFPALSSFSVQNFNYRFGCDDSGNLYLGGSFRDSPLTFGDTTLTNPDLRFPTLFLIKFDPAGNILWSTTGRNPGTTNNIRAAAWAFDGDGNSYASGDYFGAPDMGLPELGYNVYVAKFDTDGNTVWSRRITADVDSNHAIPLAMTIHTNGDYSIAGKFYSPLLQLIGMTLTNSSSTFREDIFVVRYDALGNLLWAKNGGSSESDYVNGFSSDAAGNDYLVGYSSSDHLNFGSTSLTNDNFGDVLIKFAPDGQIIWSKPTAISGGYTYKSASVYRSGVDASGNWFVLGIFDGTLRFGSITITNPSSTSAYFLCKLDSSGELIWSKVFGLIGNNYVLDWVRGPEISDLFVSASGECTLTGAYGRTNSMFDGFALTPVGAEDVFIARLPSEKPRLGIHQTPGGFVLVWPADPVGYQLEAISNLAATQWSVVTNTVVIVGANRFVTNSMIEASRFFRLHKM